MPLHAKPLALGLFLRLLATTFLAGFLCGPILFRPTALGQSDDQATKAWIGKLRSLETYDSNSSQANRPSSDTDSSLIEPPSPQRLSELLDLVLLPNPDSSNRFFLADLSARSKPRQQRLRAALESAGLLEEFQSILQMHADADSARSNAAQASKGLSLGLGDALDAILGSDQKDPPKYQNNSSIQVKRSSTNFPLLGWGPGTYQSARSTHFAIASQAGDKSTLEVTAACESVFSLWRELFADRFDLSIEQNPPFRVVLFRNREAYVRALKSIEPRISISSGYYSPEHRMAFFYWEGPKSFSTLVHELTHQFFDATSIEGSRFDPDNDPGAWAIEAVALYMESWSEEHVGGLRIIDIGRWDAPRVQAGRYRRLRDQYWIPWDEFAYANGKRLRSDPDIAAWYSQACGLAHFWLDSQGTSREAFLTYVQSVYRGQGGQAAKALIDDESLRAAYDQYLLTGSHEPGDPKENFNHRPSFLRRNELVLTRCPVQSQTLLNWPLGLRSLGWMDLGFTQVDDDLFTKTGSVPWQVNRLNLESTAITDASMNAIASMKTLSELDLSGCKVTDAGLELLAKHPSLKQLWLTNTLVTDRSIEVLASIPKLERLEVSGSLTAEGLQELMKKKPRLKKP